MIICPDTLKQLTSGILQAAGSEEREAAIVADHLVEANLCGHDSHGVGMLPTYIKNIGAGLLKPNIRPKLINDTGNLLLFDGQRGYGQVAAREAMHEAISRCRNTGLALMGLRNAFHIGRVGSYGEQSIAAALVSLHFVSVVDHEPLVAPFGGSCGRYGTNPLCIAVPGSASSDAILLDMATSKIAVGKTRVALNQGLEVPAGGLLDAKGQPTCDPAVVFANPRGAILPFGDYKGYGLGLLCEILAGALTGGGTIQPEWPRRGGIVNHMLTILIDPGYFCEKPALEKEIEALIAYIRATTPAEPGGEVLIPGDPERRYRIQRGRSGIDIDEFTWREISAAARLVGLDVSALTTEPCTPFSVPA